MVSAKASTDSDSISVTAISEFPQEAAEVADAFVTQAIIFA